jgi:tRNA U55 pseudouridine synthase TruB
LIATEGSTKLIPYLENKDKTYEFEFDITKTSPSLDLDTSHIEWK